MFFKLIRKTHKADSVVWTLLGFFTEAEKDNFLINGTKLDPTHVPTQKIVIKTGFKINQTDTDKTYNSSNQTYYLQLSIQDNKAKRNSK